MLKLTLLALVVFLGGALAQDPSPCITPPQFTARASQYDHLEDQYNRWYLSYDAVNKRRAYFEEQNVFVPGKQFLEYLELAQLNIIYEINLTQKTCKKDTMSRPWHPFGIPLNATFENEFYIGGPGEQIFAQEWSDRIPMRQRELWLGVFTVNNCYPVREVIIADYEQVNSTITTEIYDVVLGIINPNDFIPPAECNTAQWGRIKHPFGY